jgi:hypothetical protein
VPKQGIRSLADGDFYTYAGNNPASFSDFFGLVEDSDANLARRAAIAHIAMGYVGSHAFDFAVGFSRQYPKNSWKCSAFVCQVLDDAGAPIRVTPPGANARCATAGELANRRWNPKDWRSLKPGESPEPGDVAAYSHPEYLQSEFPATGHSAIVSSDGLVAAHASGVSVTPLDPLGVVYRRYTGE